MNRRVLGDTRPPAMNPEEFAIEADYDVGGSDETACSVWLTVEHKPCGLDIGVPSRTDLAALIAAVEAHVCPGR